MGRGPVVLAHNNARDGVEFASLSRMRPPSLQPATRLMRLLRPLPRLQPNSGLPEFGHLLTGRSRINPTSAGGTGRGHTTRFVLTTPSPTLPRQEHPATLRVAGTPLRE